MYMDVKIKLNGKLIIDSVDQDMVLLDFCRKHNCFSVKRGCESGNCGLCTVLLDGKRVLSCSMPIGRAGQTAEPWIPLRDLRRKLSSLQDFLLHRERISAASVIQVIL